MDNDLPPPTQKTLKRNAHIQYFLRCLRALPTQAQDNDSNRYVLASISLSAAAIAAECQRVTDEHDQNHDCVFLLVRAGSAGRAGR